jgi:hypothetical protein
MPPNPYGCTIHWNGPGMGKYTHNNCDNRLRTMEQYHVEGNGWSGIGYNLIVCRHGYIFEGRGRDRVGAHAGASNIGGNSKWYGIQAMIGTGDEVTPELKRGLVEAVKLCRSWGAGDKLNGHRDHHATDCPGDELYAWVRKGMPMAEAPPEKPTPPPQEEEDMQDYTSLADSGTTPVKLPPGEWVDVAYDTEYQDPTGSHGGSGQHPTILYGGKKGRDFTCEAGVELKAEEGGSVKGVTVQLRGAEFVYRKAEGDKPAWDELVEAYPAHTSVLAEDGMASVTCVGRVNKGRKLRIQIRHFGNEPLFITFARAAARSETLS